MFAGIFELRFKYITINAYSSAIFAFPEPVEAISVGKTFAT